MGIQINGQTDRISAVDGSFSIQDLAEVNVTGVATASNFKSGTSNVHSTGYECTNINATGIVTAASANFTGNVSVGGTLTYQDVTNIDSVGIITARAGVKIPDGQNLTLGTDGDVGIKHQSGHFEINNSTGNTYFQTNGQIRLRGKHSGSTEEMIIATAGSSVEFYFDNVKKFETHADGLHIGDGGNLDMPHDSSKIVMGASDDLQIYHDGSNSRIKNTAGSLWLQSDTGIRFTDSGVNESMAAFYDNGAVELYYDGSKKFETNSTGIHIFGNTGHADGAADLYGSGNDLSIVHDGTNATIDNATGDLYLRANADDVIIQAADDIFIKPQGGEDGIKVLGDGSVELFHNGSLRFQTNATATTMRGGGAHRCEGTFRPWANNTYDLGTSGDRWRNIYTNDLNLSNEGSGNDVDGTWGNYTIQEGENDLYLINRRNGKKYKFNLTEVK